MMRALSSLAVTALGLTSFACSHSKAPDALATAAEVKPIEASPSDLPALPEAPALTSRKPTGLRDPDLLNDLPTERQFDPTKTVTSSPSDGSLVTSPPSVKSTPPPAPEN